MYNTNMPSDSPCSNGSSYQYWLNYLTGGAVINGENTTSMSLVGKTFGDFLVSGASLVQDAKGRLHTITIGQDGRVHDRDVVVGADPSLVRRTSWRELIRE